MSTQNHKPWWSSKTLWFNFISLVVTIATALQAVPGIPSKFAVWLAGAIAIGNAIIRFYSNSKIK